MSTHPTAPPPGSPPARPAPGAADAMAALAKAAETAAADPAAPGPGRRDPIIDPADRQRAAPVHLWSPADCGPIDMRIRSDGLWFYLGTPIGREPLVQLFASVLTKAPDGRHYLVTPAEKVEIAVDDVAFVATDVEEAAEADPEAGPTLELLTNVGDRLRLGLTRRLRVAIDPATGEPTPYVPVRGQLEARIDRKTFYRLVDRSEFVDIDDAGRPIDPAIALGVAARRAFGFWSGAQFFALATGSEAEAIEAAAHA